MADLPPSYDEAVNNSTPPSNRQPSVTPSAPPLLDLPGDSNTCPYDARNAPGQFAGSSDGASHRDREAVPLVRPATSSAVRLTITTCNGTRGGGSAGNGSTRAAATAANNSMTARARLNVENLAFQVLFLVLLVVILLMIIVPMVLIMVPNKK